MASNTDFVQYIADQCSGAGEIVTKKMFGDYGIYCDGKIFGLNLPLVPLLSFSFDAQPGPEWRTGIAPGIDWTVCMAANAHLYRGWSNILAIEIVPPNFFQLFFWLCLAFIFFLNSVSFDIASPIGSTMSNAVMLCFASALTACGPILATST